MPARTLTLVSLGAFILAGAGSCALGTDVLRPPPGPPPVVEIAVPVASAEAALPAEEPAEAAQDDMIWIPGGAFVMGTTTCDADEAPEHRVDVKGFYLDATEVSTGDYARCVADGRCSAEVPQQDDENEDGTHCNAPRRDRAEHPMNCVTWTQADQFCRVHDKRLPTETEWEFAARGPEGRAFPWGNAWDPDRLCWNRTDGTCPIGATRAGDTPLGLVDMAGNVWEWTASLYCDYDGSPCNDTGYVDRGGGWISEDARLVHSAHRGRGDPETWASYLGFRCARDP